MGSTIKKILFGSFIAIICATVLIYAIESHRSLYQIFFGFILFVIPFSFISTFFSRIGSFIFVFISIMIGFIITKYGYHDFWLGILLAAIIGSAVFYYVTTPAIKTMKETNPFSANEYKKQAKQYYDNKKVDK